MRQLTTLAITGAVLIAGASLVAQQRMTPTEPGTQGDPVWQGVLRTPDGRTFVTDGGLVIDAAIVRPATLPGREFPPKLLQDFFSAPHTGECGFAEFAPATPDKTYSTPTGIAVSANYVDYLRRILPRSARFRFGGPTQPVVVVVDAKPVGAFMPVRQ